MKRFDASQTFMTSPSFYRRYKNLHEVVIFSNWFPALWRVTSHTLCTAFHFGLHTAVDFILALTHIEREWLDLKRALHFEIGVNLWLGSWNKNKVFWMPQILFCFPLWIFSLLLWEVSFFDPVWSGENCRSVLTLRGYANLQGWK